MIPSIIRMKHSKSETEIVRNYGNLVSNFKHVLARVQRTVSKDHSTDRVLLSRLRNAVPHAHILILNTCGIAALDRALIQHPFH